MNINVNTDKATKLNTSNSIILVFTSIVLGILVWFMLPFGNLGRFMVMLMVGVWILAAPIYIMEHLTKKYENITERKATVITMALLLTIPVVLNLVYLVKHDTVLNTIPTNKQLEIKVEVDKNLISNNSVGDDWYFDINVDGKELSRTEDYKILTVNCNSTLRIDAEVVESDNVPDRGRGSLDIDLTRLDYTQYNSFSVPVTVREQRGRYSGNTAEWEIVFKIKRNLNFWQIVFG